ncbi:MAG: type VI secretion system protein TssA [Tepidisphaerales bacterium]
MGSLNVEKLLEPVSADNPVGEDISIAPEFFQLEELAKGKPEQQMGDQIIPAEDPDWKELLRFSCELLGRSKDLQVVLHAARAAIPIHGVAGICDGLALVRGLLEKYWADLYPKLDPEDNNDPLMRMNMMSTLTHRESYLKLVREAPLADSKRVGRFALKDIEIAKGEAPAPENRNPSVPLPDQALVNGAFEEMPLEALQEKVAALGSAVEHAKAIDQFLTKTCGAGKAFSFDDLAKMLAACQRHTSEALSRRQGGTTGATEETAVAAGGASAPVAGGAAPGVGGVPGEIRSKADIIKVMDKICDYYQKYEPSSPIPLLLRRVQRLVNKSFMDIIKDLSPGTVGTIEQLAGIDASQQQQS